MTASRGPNQTLDVIAGAIYRLDQRYNVIPAHMEFMRGTSDDGGWVAQLVADPLRAPVVGWGPTTFQALDALAREVERIDWRRVRRGRSGARA